MKALMVTIAAALFSLNVAAYNPGDDPTSYCAKNKNGRTIVEHNGTAITSNITFKDGTTIQPNGTVVLTSGETVMLKEGECVNENTVMDLSKDKGEKIGDQKDPENQKDVKDESEMNKQDSTKTDETLDPDRYKNDQTIPPKDKREKDSEVPN